MPIKAFIGRPRQGKSYSVVKNVILPALKNKRTVVTNIPLKGKAYEEFAQFINFQPKIDYDNIVNGAVYVIDEIWLDFPAGLTQAKLSETHRHFLAMHAHTPSADGYTTEIVVITQNLSQIATAITDLVETTYYVEKVKISDKIHKCRTEEFNGSVKGNPPKTKPIGSKLDVYDSEVFEYYKSHTGAKKDENIIEMDSIKAKTLLDFKFVKYFPIALIIFLIVVLPYGIKSFKSITAPDDVESDIKKLEPSNNTIKKINSGDSVASNNKISEISSDSSIDHSEKAQDIVKNYDFFDELNVFPESQDMRITGSYKYVAQGINWEGIQVTIKNQRTINLPIQFARIDDYGEMFVVYRNQIVTKTSGSPDPIDLSHLPDGSFVQVLKSDTDNKIINGLTGESE